MRARVIGIGQATAGDDGVGLAVLDHLRAAGAPPGVELVRAAEPSALVSLLDGADAIVVVDALLGGEPGEVRCLAPEELETQRLESLSTHGVGVAEAVALARLLTPEAVAPHVHIVGVCVAQARRWVPGLSAPVAAAVPRAAALVQRLVTDGAAAADGA